MQLLDYLELKTQSVTDFAAEVHARLGGRPKDEDGLRAAITRVWRHAHGKRRPGPEDITIYDELTKGAVTAQDWVDLALKPRDPPDAAAPAAATG